MNTKVDGLNIDYSDVGKGQILVLLHGWARGLSKEKYSNLINLLSKNFRVIALDFPGFGGSDQPPCPWGVDSYAKLVVNFLTKLKVKPIAIIGHSFGGKVAIKLTATNMTRPKKLILIASAGIERPSLKVKILKLLSRYLPQKIKAKYGQWFRSRDYQQCSGVLRQSMKLVVSENLEDDIARIKTTSCLIWGDQDNTTPLWQAKIIHELIKNSTLVKVEGENHGLPYNNPSKTAQVIKNFLA